MAVNSPNSVGIRVEAMRRTSFSLRVRYSIRSLIVIILRLKRLAMSYSSGSRAMPPCSSSTSQMTPAG